MQYTPDVVIIKQKSCVVNLQLRDLSTISTPNILHKFAFR